MCYKQNNLFQVMTRLCIEVGGTSLRIAFAEYPESSSKPQLTEPVQIPNLGFEPCLAQILQIVSESQKKIASIGISTFGPVCLNFEDSRFGFILSGSADVKKSWVNNSLIVRLAEALEIPKTEENLKIETDVNGAVLAELKLGDHNLPAKPNLIYITVGTGIGTGVMVKGELVHGYQHPEGGHVICHLHKKEDPTFDGVCNYHKHCVESLATNVSIAARLGLEVGDLPGVEDGHWVWEAAGYYLAQLVMNVSYVVAPHCVIIGGGVLNRKEVIGWVRKYFKELNNDYIVFPGIF